jgi:hypothetical protein
MFGRLGDVSLAPVRPPGVVVPHPPIGPEILLVFFFTQIGGANRYGARGWP